jgi:NADH-quinone oxidoreductase subunit A
MPISLFHIESSKIGILIIIAILISIIIIAASFVLGPSLPDSEKLSIYECGFDPYEDARNAFDVRFYLIAILFIIFDLETVFFFPWCISLSLLNDIGIWSMLDFIVELLIGYIYAWLIGALNWK